MAGRRPKPTALKILFGTDRKSRLNQKEPQPKEANLAQCPIWLCVEGKKEWRRLARKLKDVGILSELDMTAFTVYCQMWGEYIAGIKANEPVSMAHVTQMRLMAAEFGLTPSSRSRVVAVDLLQPKANDPWDDL